MKKSVQKILAILLIASVVSLCGCAKNTSQVSSDASQTDKASETVVYDLSHFEDYKDDFMYIYSPICKSFGEFKQDKDGLSSYRNDELIKNSAEGTDVPDYFPVNPDEFAYISLLTNKKYSEGTVATLHCSFDKMGAPLIAFTDDINNDGEHNIYGLHFEVVAFNEGCNVWEIRTSKDDKEWPIDPTLIAEPKFSIEDKTPVEIKVEFGKKEVIATVNGHTSQVKIDNMPESYHIGFTTCEGINHFYDFTIETK